MIYLILHKVRGEPAFDIAEPMQIGDEEGWIIPTSGHRAYPYWHLPLDKFDIPPASAPPDGWPDHYSNESSVEARKGNGLKIDIGAILSNVGPRIKRRI